MAANQKKGAVILFTRHTINKSRNPKLSNEGQK